MPAVLIVDDDKHTRALLRTIFEQDPRFAKLALEVHEAGEGIEGLMKFDQHRPAIVIADLMMPRMDGFKLCEAIRSREHGRQTGLVVVSGIYRDQKSITKVQQEFRALWFQKPYQISDLAGAVEKLLGGARRTDIVAPEAPDAPAEGSLAELPLGRLLFDLHERRVTGMLELRRARMEKRIDLVVGHPVSVSSNQRHEALGPFLLARGLINEDQQQRAVRLAHERDLKLGEALVELGALTVAQLVKALTAQARAKIVSALRWGDGSWRYTPNRELLDRHKGNALDPALVVLYGLSQAGQLDDAVRAVEAVGGQPLRLTARGERYRAQIQKVLGGKILEALARPASVPAVLEVWPDAAPVMQALEALLVSGCIEPVGAPAAAPPAAAPPLRPGPSPKSATIVAAAAPPPSRTPALAPAPAPQLAAPRRADPVALAGLSQAVEAVTAPGRAPAPEPARGQALFDELFGDESLSTPVGGVEAVSGAYAAVSTDAADTSSGVPAPVAEMPSGLIEMATVEVLGEGPGATAADDAAALAEAREALLAEFLRVQGKDPYQVLQIARDADAAAIESAFSRLSFDMALERFAAFDLGGDHGKLEEVHAAYRRAHDLLIDPAQRAQVDAAERRPSAGRALEGEMAFSDGDARLAAGDLSAAVTAFERAVSAAPDAADYHAALGWALYRRGPAVGAAEQSREQAIAAAAGHLEQALAIDPDHPAAHEYLGRLLVDSGGDDARAARHLERALATRPPRMEALPALDALRTRRGEFAQLERQYRLLIHATGESDRALALRLWLALTDLYRVRLDDVDAARIALGAAARLGPNDPQVARALDELTSGRPELWPLRVRALRMRWRLDPGDSRPARELLIGARAAQEPDLEAVVAALLSVRDPELDEAGAVYRRFRPRFLQRAQQPLSLALAGLRHAGDRAELDELFALLAPLLDRVAPVDLGALGVGAGDELGAQALPEPIARVRAYLAGLFGVSEPRVFHCADFGDQAHVGAPSGQPAVLLAGPALLESSDRVLVGHRLARAMSYLWPGRAAAGARPGRVLRATLLGALATGGPGLPQVSLPASDQIAAAARDFVLAQPEPQRDGLRRLLARLVAGRTSLDLSAAVHAMAYTADRVGLLVCGDAAIALRGAEAAGGPDAAVALCDYAVSPEHLAARRALGLSIDV